MPIFEYRCPRCGEQFEKIVMGSSSSVECPACSSTEVEKMISSFAAQSRSDGRACRAGDPAACAGGT
ncbi:MAG TPA: zinc ribbon domain-containing protein [Acidobacteriota bacterium]|nr:zinc ribbon domain-containing protein [Acidobacteriota bacterium]